MLLKITLTFAAVLASCQEGAESTNCKTGRCTDIEGTPYCSECAVPTEAPVNGECKEVSADPFCTGNGAGACSACKGASFMYKGGCYEQAKPPGSDLCKSTNNAGVCTAPNVSGKYFVPPDTDASHQSIVGCGDTSGMRYQPSDGIDKAYKGEANCETCTAPQQVADNTGTATATCTKCAGSNIVKTDTDGTTCIPESECPTANGFFVEDPGSGNQKKCNPCSPNCLSCTSAAEATCASCTAETHFLAAETGQPGKCVSCGDAVTGSGDWKGVSGCAKCTKPEVAGAATCTECTSDYLKTDAGTTSCVQKGQCNGGYFPNDNVDGKKQCIPCGTADHGGVAGCTACSPLQPASMVTAVLVKCSACAPNSKPNVAGTGCFTCSIDGCDNCSENGVCEKCGNAKKVSPGKNSCVEQCPENSIEKESVCVCNSGYDPDSAGTGCVTVSINLSTGAIAGISVAAIVVVGGLVGFLCWWFICRGKA
ncbi:VSP [Giardia lamblia P15]|uniref:VSP n=1 Tax=Giardia intestinalis (strain P15) TaxID=658858 RepID=E1F891_GIAIA|nr:VSP [Giardia lamblia P15]